MINLTSPLLRKRVLGWVFIQHDDNLWHIVQFWHHAHIFHRSTPLLILPHLKTNTAISSQQNTHIARIIIPLIMEQWQHITYIKQTTIAQYSQKWVNMTFACEVQTCPHMSSWAWYTMWVTAKHRTHQYYCNVMTFHWIYYIHPKTVKLSETKFVNSDSSSMDVAASHIKFITTFMRVWQSFS
jgi:hypothetical protein